MKHLLPEMNSDNKKKAAEAAPDTGTFAMLKKIILAVAAFVTLSTGAITPASAIGLGSFSRSGAFSRDYTPGRAAPLAFQLFCLKYRNECKTGKGRAQVSYNARVHAILNSVNRSVNASIRPVSDRTDTWSLNPKSGDCEDFALTKRSRLIRAGLPASALRIAVVRTRSGEGHAVLLVKTSAGEFVLDNIRKTVMKRHAMPYRVVSISGSNPLRWNNG